MSSTSGREHAAVTRFRSELDSRAGTGEIVVLPGSVHTAALAAAALGCEVGAIANSLLFDADGAPVLVLTSGAHRVDTREVAASIGVASLRRATPEFVREHTGQVIGGVSPLGHPNPVPTYIDPWLRRYAVVWAAAGHPAAVFSTTFEELVRMTGAVETAVERPPPDLTVDTVRAALVHRLGGLLRGRRIVCGVAPLAALVEWVTLLGEAGAERPLLVASAVGAGATPTADEAEVVFLDVPEAPSLTDELRRHDRAVRHLPDAVVAAVEAYDPDRGAGWLVTPFIGTEPILGREVLTGRPAAWTALEDKLVADDLWDAVGAPRARSRVVPVELGALRDASADLDDGEGVVWAGDARDGFNGAGDFVRRVAPGADGEVDAAAAHGFFAPRCDRVRVMPFLDGVPCSIHAMVLPEGTAVFRPVELAILRGPARTFVYGGLGTSWDPPEQDRAQMRDLARRTGEHLRDLVGYRGAFGIDGILTSDGFLPTELNARMTGGLNAMARAVDASLFNLLQFNLMAGRDPGFDAASLERWAVPALDAARFATAIALAPVGVATEPVDVPVAWDGARLTRSEEETGWLVSAGPNPAGTFVRLVTPADVGVVRVADLNVALMGFLDVELGACFGELESAPDVRRR